MRLDPLAFLFQEENGDALKIDHT